MATPMLVPGWYVVLESAEVTRRGPHGFRRFGVDLVAFRDEGGRVVVLGDRCPHRGAALHLGCVRGGAIACPFHGFEFDRSGACTKVPVLGPDAKIPASLATPSWDVREQDDWVFVWHGPRVESLDSAHPTRALFEAGPPRFEVLDGPFVHHTIADEWPASMARVIENQLDPFHLPFVHSRTIGRNMPSQMRVQHVVRGERVRAWPGDAPESEEPFYIELRMPNLWINFISRAFCIVAAFAPIDDVTTRTYVRAYQRFARFPGLRWLAGVILRASNRRIFSEDRRVVVSQPQGWPAAGDEVLVKADGAIIAYRKLVESRASDHALVTSLQKRPSA